MGIQRKRAKKRSLYNDEVLLWTWLLWRFWKGHNRWKLQDRGTSLGLVKMIVTNVTIVMTGWCCCSSFERIMNSGVSWSWYLRLKHGLSHSIHIAVLSFSDPMISLGSEQHSQQKSMVGLYANLRGLNLPRSQWRSAMTGRGYHVSQASTLDVAACRMWISIHQVRLRDWALSDLGLWNEYQALNKCLDRYIAR